MRTLALATFPLLLLACQSGDDEKGDVLDDGTPSDAADTDTDTDADSDTDTDTDSDSDTDTDTDTDTDVDTQTGETGDGTTACSYPPGAVEPMALGEVLTAYSWPEARHMDGVRTASLELEHAPCDTDDDIEWSPHDVLVFVSIPAW